MNLLVPFWHTLLYYIRIENIIATLRNIYYIKYVKFKKYYTDMVVELAALDAGACF